MTLYWQVPPRVESLRVVARFTTPDGRAFEADKDIKVRLLPGAAGRPEMPIVGDVPTFRSLPGACPVEFGPILPPNLRPVSHTQAAQEEKPATPLIHAVHIGPPSVGQPPPNYALISPIHGVPTNDELQSEP